MQEAGPWRMSVAGPLCVLPYESWCCREVVKQRSERVVVGTGRGGRSSGTWPNARALCRACASWRHSMGCGGLGVTVRVFCVPGAQR